MRVGGVDVGTSSIMFCLGGRRSCRFEVHIMGEVSLTETPRALPETPRP